MARRRSVAVLLMIETDDPALISAPAVPPTAASVAGIRRAVMRHLPGRVQRVVAVMDERSARIAMQIHDEIMSLAGDPPIRPPPDYIPPDK